MNVELLRILNEAEKLKEFVLMLFRYADPSIFNLDLQVLSKYHHLDVDGPLFCKFERV